MSPLFSHVEQKKKTNGNQSGFLDSPPFCCFCVRLLSPLPAAALESLTFFECKLTNERHCWVARQPGHFINLFMHVSLHLRLLICKQLDRDTRALQYQYCQGGRRPRRVVVHFKASRIIFRGTVIWDASQHLAVHFKSARNDK